MTTQTSDVLIPEVLAPMITARITDKMGIAGSPAVMMMNNLTSARGTKVKLPRWSAVDNLNSVNEADRLPTSDLDQESVEAEVRLYGRSVSVTEQALQASFADPLGEIASQFARLAAKAIDKKLIDVATATSLSKTSTETIKLNDIADARGKFNEYADEAVALVVHPKVYTDLLKLSEFRQVNSQKADAVVETGQVGDIFGIPVRISSQVKTTGTGDNKKYQCLLLRRGALGLWMQKQVTVETDRDIGKPSTELAVHFLMAAGLYPDDPKGAVKLEVK